MADNDDEGRFSEIEMLQSMYTMGEELTFPDEEDLYFFILKLTLDPDDGSDPATVELSCRMPSGYPGIAAVYSINCERIHRKLNDRFTQNLVKALRDEFDGEGQVLRAIEWVQENGTRYFAQEVEASVSGYEKRLIAAVREPKGFMREWCSFASLYKDSYISGPDRFETIIALATKRGLSITGMAIAGKPGGLVCEGEEGDVVEFMELMRTEFFETLNPRGRKLVTRLQERWPLDDEINRYEAATIVQKLKDDFYRKADREAAEVKRPSEKEINALERLEKQEAEDRTILKAWEAKNRRTLNTSIQEGEDAEVEKLIKAGPPSKCTTKGIYSQCGCEAPPPLEEIEKQRVFKDFTVFAGKAGFEPCYQDAAKIFKDMDQMNGFDAMFAFRFS